MILVVITITTIATYFLLNREDGLQVDKDVFRKLDLKTVNQVTLKSGKQNIILSLDGSRWKVNGQYEADQQMIEVLFATLLQVEPKRPIQSNRADSVALRLRNTGVEVTLQTTSGETQQFLAGGNVKKTQAYFATPDGDVYVMHIPGYRVYAAGVFELEENGWRDKYVFGFNWRNFKSLEAQFADPKENFSIVMQDNQVVITGVEADTARLNTYLDDVSLLTVDGYIEAPASDSLKNWKPLFSILVKDIGNREFPLVVYGSTENGKFRAQLKTGQWAVLSSQKIVAISRPKSFLVKR